MSFNNKRQPLSSFSKRWMLSKSRLSSKPKGHPFTKSPYQKTISKSFSKSLPKNTLQTHPSFEHQTYPSTFLTLQQQPKSKSSLQQISQSPQQQHQNIDLDQLQIKIDKLLKQKLRILIEFNKHKTLTKTHNTPFNFVTVQSLLQINNELQALIVQIKTNIECYKSNKNIEKWKFLDKKIKMLEKVLAENYSQMEIMKKFYSKVSHSGTSYRNFCKNKEESNVSKIKNTNLRLLKDKIANSLSPTSRLPFISESKVQFQVPSNNFTKLNKSLATYNRFSLQNSRNSDESIIQTSAYKRQYRKYPNFEDVQMTQRHCSLPFNPFTKTIQSSYKYDYNQPFKSKQKQIQNQTLRKQEEINYKKLDCYRNKIKSMNLNYSLNIEKPISKLQNQEYFRMNYRINKARTQPDVVMTPGIMTASSPFTPMADGDDKLYRARPKNNRLEALKSSFRSFITNQ